MQGKCRFGGQDARPTRRHARRATVVVYVAISLTFMIGMAALAVDIGAMYSAQAELQRAADAAAMAAAAELAEGDPQFMEQRALDAADQYARLNTVLGSVVGLDSPGDLELGKAAYNATSGRFEFEPGGAILDAVRVTLRRSEGSAAGPIQLAFAGLLGHNTGSLQARAAAVLIPRDIAVVIDLSGSMNDDSELRHYKSFQGELGQWRDGVQINLRDIWCALDGPAPDRPYVPGGEGETQYAGDTGPTIYELNDWGSEIVVETYDPTADPGLWRIPKSASCSESAVSSRLSARGYSSEERSALTSGSKDSSYSSNWRNRVAVILGFADWSSGKPGGRSPSGGNGNDIVGNSEISWYPKPGFVGSMTWTSYINYVRSTSSRMYNTNSAFRYRYGIKTFVNYLLEKRPRYSQTDVLWQTPEQPLQAVKDAVQAMIDVIDSLESLDHVSLEVFATSASHEVDLTENLQSVPDRLYEMQAGHYDTTTNIGGALALAISELTSGNARPAASKVIVLMSDGKPNIDEGGSYVGNSAPSVLEYVRNMAQQAADQGMRIYTISVGQDVDMDLMIEIAEIGGGQHFHAEGTPEQYSEQLEDIFRTLGGKRPVSLIE